MKRGFPKGTLIDPDIIEKAMYKKPTMEILDMDEIEQL